MNGRLLESNVKINGLDGCSQGWVVATLFESRLYLTKISNLLDLYYGEAELWLIDMPVKCPLHLADYPRPEDVKAKSFLGRQHGSIFYAPVESWLTQPYSEINNACEIDKKPKLSKQSFNLFPKIREVLASPIPFLESHPECIFVNWYGKSLPSKYSKEGKALRKILLANVIDDTAILNLNECLLVWSDQQPAAFEVDAIDALALCLRGWQYSQSEVKTFSKNFIY